MMPSIAGLIVIPFLLAAGTLAQVAPERTDTPVSSSEADAHYMIDETDIGTLLDDPAAKAILEKRIPTIVRNPGIEQARTMTLKQVQSYASDTLTDNVLAEIQADLFKLPAK